MVDRTHDLPVTQQCKILSLSRSTAYCKPQGISHTDLALKRRIDELSLEYPFGGSRMLRDLMRRNGFVAGRRHIATLVKKMRIVARHKKPNTSRRHPAAGTYGGSIPPAVHRDHASHSGLRSRYHLHANETWLGLSICRDGLGGVAGAGLAPVKYAGRPISASRRCGKPFTGTARLQSSTRPWEASSPAWNSRSE